MAENASKTNTAKRKRVHLIPHEKFIHLKFSEYSMQKYDDLEHTERKVLIQMDKSDRIYWQLNHFRSIREFDNDGDKISEVLSSLAQKHYIRRVTAGPKKTRQEKRAESATERDRRKKASSSKWVLNR